jgi:hypothetical protein
MTFILEVKRLIPAGQVAIAPAIFEPPRCLFTTVAFLNSDQCRVPPSPPAIRGMKKPRQRKFAGASDSGSTVQT